MQTADFSALQNFQIIANNTECRFRFTINRPDLTTNSFLEKKCFQLRFLQCHQKRARNNKRDSANKYVNKASMITIYIQKQ